MAKVISNISEIDYERIKKEQEISDKEIKETLSSIRVRFEELEKARLEKEIRDAQRKDDVKEFFREDRLGSFFIRAVPGLDAIKKTGKVWEELLGLPTKLKNAFREKTEREKVEEKLKRVDKSEDFKAQLRGEVPKGLLASLMSVSPLFKFVADVDKVFGLTAEQKKRSLLKKLDEIKKKSGSETIVMDTPTAIKETIGEELKKKDKKPPVWLSDNKGLLIALAIPVLLFLVNMIIIEFERRIIPFFKRAFGPIVEKIIENIHNIQRFFTDKDYRNEIIKDIIKPENIVKTVIDVLPLPAAVKGVTKVLSGGEQMIRRGFGLKPGTIFKEVDVGEKVKKLISPKKEQTGTIVGQTGYAELNLHKGEVIAPAKLFDFGRFESTESIREKIRGIKTESTPSTISITPIINEINGLKSIIVNMFNYIKQKESVSGDTLLTDKKYLYMTEEYARGTV